MALLKSIASGNFTDAATWGVCFPMGGTLETTANTTIASTTAYVGGVLTSATAFTQASTNALGVLVKIARRVSTISGTITGALLDSANTVLAECTMNCVDVVSTSLPTTGATSAYGHWVFFKFNAPIAITNGTQYKIGFKTSVSSSVLFGSANTTLSNVYCAIVTSATQAPIAGDRFIIVGDNVASPTTPGTTPGTKASYTVTMNNTNTTQFGDGLGIVAGIPYWSLYVGDNATLDYGTAVATNYNLRVRGNVGVGSGGDSYKGTLNIGTVATPIPRGSTAQLEIDSATAVNHFFQVQGGIFNAQGLSRTAGKDIDRCLLNADAAAAATSLTVDTDTGWLSGDEVYIGQTTRVSGGGAEARVLNANATATGLSISAGLTAAKEGNTTIKAAIVLQTRNVTITAVSSTLQFYWSIIGTTSVVDCDWVRFRWYGTALALKQGGYLDGAAATTSFNRCIFDAPYIGFIWTTTTGGAIITNCAVIAAFIGVSSTSFGTGTSFSNFWGIQFGSGGMTIRDLFPMSDIRLAGSTGYGITFGAAAAALTAPITYNNFTIHSCTNALTGTIQQDIETVVFNNADLQRNTTCAYNMSTSASGVLFTNSRLWGNTGRNIYNSAGCGVTIFRDSVIASQTSNTTVAGVEFNLVTQGLLVFENCQFGAGPDLAAALAHTSFDIYYPATTAGPILLRNCLLGTSEVSTLIYNNSSVISENHDRVVGSKKIWFKRGIVASDTTIVRTGGRSLRLTPNNASFKLDYVFAKVAVTSGSAPTVGIYVRKSVAGDGTAYTGAQPRLIVRRNILVGITTDTVIATATNAANGAWELVSGSLPTLTGNGVVELELDCDGAAGWVNIDDLQAPTAVDTKSFAAGDDTLGIPSYGDNSSGGGGAPVTVGYAFVG